MTKENRIAISYNYVLKINVRKSAINVTKQKYTPKLIFKYTFIGILMNDLKFKFYVNKINKCLLAFI